MKDYLQLGIEIKKIAGILQVKMSDLVSNEHLKAEIKWQTTR